MSCPVNWLDLMGFGSMMAPRAARVARAIGLSAIAPLAIDLGWALSLRGRRRGAEAQDTSARPPSPTIGHARPWRRSRPAIRSIATRSYAPARIRGETRLPRFDRSRRRPHFAGDARQVRLCRQVNGQKMTVNLAKGIFRFTTGALDKKAYTIATRTPRLACGGRCRTFAYRAR